MLSIMNLMTESLKSSTAYLSAKNKIGMAFSVVITIVPEDGVEMSADIKETHPSA